MVSVITDSTSVSLLDLPPTRQQTRVAFALMVILLLTFGATATFANVHLRPPIGLGEILLTLTFATNLVTAILIFSQCSITHSRALLLLASGYLFSSLIMIPNITIAGDFSWTASLGTSNQRPFIYAIWHFGFSTAVICYALLKDSTPISTQRPIGWSILIVVGVYRGEFKASPQQLRAAIESLPYENPKLTAVAVGHLTGEDFYNRLEQAINRSQKVIEGRATEVEDQ
jgi:hypothetical protein